MINIFDLTKGFLQSSDLYADHFGISAPPKVSFLKMTNEGQFNFDGEVNAEAIDEFIKVNICP